MRVEILIEQARNMSAEDLAKCAKALEKPKAEDILHDFGVLEDPLVRGMQALYYKLDRRIQVFVGADINALLPTARNECRELIAALETLQAMICNDLQELYLSKVPEPLARKKGGHAVIVASEWHVVILSEAPQQAGGTLIIATRRSVPADAGVGDQAPPRKLH